MSLISKSSSQTTDGTSSDHLSLRLPVVPNFLKPSGISVSSFQTRPWGLQVPPKIIYPIFILLCKRPGGLQLGLPSSGQAAGSAVLWFTFPMS